MPPSQATRIKQPSQTSLLFSDDANAASFVGDEGRPWWWEAQSAPREAEADKKVGFADSLHMMVGTMSQPVKQAKEELLYKPFDKAETAVLPLKEGWKGAEAELESVKSGPSASAAVAGHSFDAANCALSPIGC